MRKRRPNCNSISSVILFIYSPPQNLRHLWGLLNPLSHTPVQIWMCTREQNFKADTLRAGAPRLHWMWKSLATKNTECTSSLGKPGNLTHCCTDEQEKQMLPSPTSSAKPLTLDRFPFFTETKTTGQIAQEKADPEWALMCPSHINILQPIYLRRRQQS